MHDVEVLERLGLDSAQVIAVRCLLVVWRAIDFKSPLWKSSGVKIYDRFESRVRAASYSRGPKEFVSALGLKCQIGVPRAEADFFYDMEKRGGEVCGDVMKSIRKMPGLLIAAMRVVQEEKKKEQIND